MYVLTPELTNQRAVSQITLPCMIYVHILNIWFLIIKTNFNLWISHGALFSENSVENSGIHFVRKMPLRKLFAVFFTNLEHSTHDGIYQNHISIGLMHPNCLSSGMLNQFKVYRIMMMAVLAPIRHLGPLYIPLVPQYPLLLYPANLVDLLDKLIELWC